MPEPLNVTAKIVVYATQYCPYCWRAKDLLTAKGVDFDEIDVGGDRALRQQMTELSGGHTVPQILINGTPIGGCDELYALEHDGRLDPLLTGEA